MKKYKIIYADPPWQYKVYSEKGKGRSAENHYPTMSIEDICKLPIKDLADDDCVLFMWMTFPTLKEGFKVIEEWGFKYKTVAFVWVKQNKKTPSLFWGLGFWTRANAEICIFPCPSLRNLTSLSWRNGAKLKQNIAISLFRSRKSSLESSSPIPLPMTS